MALISRQPPMNSSLTCVAPKFSLALSAGVAECNAAGWDVVIYETCRSAALQIWYFNHGASHAADLSHSWHGYGLAADLVSRQHGWDLWGRKIPTAWQSAVVEILKSHNLAWGGDWQATFANGEKDWPHFEWGGCPSSPLASHRTLFDAGTPTEVWPMVGAL